MAGVFRTTEIDGRKIGRSVTIPDNPQAKLMYYLDCMCVVLDMRDQQNLARLRNYTSYYVLTDAEIDALVALCFLLSPDELKGKVIFQDDEMCGDGTNEFYELKAVQRNLLVANNILIGGQRREVHKIMTFKSIWMQRNWIEPMQHFSSRLVGLANGQRTQNQQPSPVNQQSWFSRNCVIS